MKKEEIRQDPIRDKIISSIAYLDENKNIFVNLLVAFIVCIGGFSYYKSVKANDINDASGIGGVAQNLYNLNQSSDAINEMQSILDDYKDTPSAVHSYIYLLSDSYNNNDTLKIKHLLNNYDIKVKDPVLSSYIYELKANFSDNIESKISYLLEAVKVSTPSTMGRMEISLAKLYIDNDRISDAIDILDRYSSDETNFNLKNSAAQLRSFIDNK